MNEIVRNVRVQSWMEMVRAQKESGMTVSSWCRENGISEHSYYYRLSRLRELAVSRATEFVEIENPDSATAETGAHNKNLSSSGVIRCDGFSIELADNAGSELIRNLIGALHAH